MTFDPARQAQFPSQVWDGRTDSRHNRAVYREADDNDYEQILIEMQATQTRVLTNSDDIVTLQESGGGGGGGSPVFDWLNFT